MGLGSYPAVDLAEAHRKWREAATSVAKGIDLRLARRDDPANLTFLDAAEAYLPEASTRLSAKSKYILQLALRAHCAPLASRPVLEIGTRDCANLLKSIAAIKPEMAEKVRAALRGLFAHVGIDMEDRGVVMRNPLTPAGLKAAGYIPEPSKGRHAALDPAEAYAFMKALRAIPSTDARLLEFVILTVSRAGAARLARFDQIGVHVDVQTGVRTPVWRPEQLKDARSRKGRPFNVPLAPRALEIVEAARASSTLIFSDAGDEPLNDMALIALVSRMCRARPWLDPTSKRWITTHGFRSTFRTWCQTTRRDREVVEIAMGHRFHGAVESRYARGDLLDERRKLINDWASYLDTPPVSAEIIPLRA
jgi:integrase